MLVDALRPPAGTALDSAVGTTFTLDLDALLLATLSFAVADRLDTEDGRPDPIALLESVRRHADHITVFAQTGVLSGPRNHPPILSYLEDAVIPVRPAVPGHLFHPKVWALKFVDEEGEPSYRLLVLSRNLTFDSSWDTIVRLDGKPANNTRKHDGLVADFLETLPKRAVVPLADDRTKQVFGLAQELRSVAWEKPEGVQSMWFWPMGPEFKKPEIAGDRVLTISPFLSESSVRQFGTGPGEVVLISRPPAIDGAGASALAGYADTFVVDTADELPPSGPLDDAPASDSEGLEDEIVDATGDIDIEPPRPGTDLSGLHAKVWVTENEDSNRLWIGSANATGPAFNGNVEFMVEFCFDHANLSIDSVLDNGEPNLRSMLKPYRPETDEPSEPTELEKATRKLDTLVRDLATGSFAVAVSYTHLTLPTKRIG